MTFLSSQFAIFLAGTYLLWLLVPVKLRWLVLLAASVWFCAAVEPMFLVPLVGSGLLAYLFGLGMNATIEPARRKALVAVGIGLLVANLALFKYAGVFGWHLAMPIGISFYTFLLIGYLVDVYRGAAPEREPKVFAMFVLLFPKLVSGPIERSRDLLPQLRLPQVFNYSRTVVGLRLILWGAFKKLVVADNLAPFVAYAFDHAELSSGPVTIMATVFYAFQLYCDFSGYTDMAIGVAALFGYRLAPNFNRPYTAISIQDFWKRWHISLTSWLTDYVYSPITRQKLVKIKLYYLMLIGLLFTFVISGIWHGSHWNFVAWGALHGFYIVFALVTQRQRNKLSDITGISRRPRLRRHFRIAVTFALVCMAYVLFRAPSIGDSLVLYASLLKGWGSMSNALREFISEDALIQLSIGVAGIVLVLVVEMLSARQGIVTMWLARAYLRRLAYFACAMVIVVFGGISGSEQDFIYFQF